MSPAWRRIVLRGVLFAAPLAVVLGAAVWALARLGELACVDIPHVVQAQRTETNASRGVLWGPAYSDCTGYLKMVGIAAERPEVLVLGTSRSVEVRAAFFRGSFYNGGGAVARTSELRMLLDRLPRERQPTTIFIVLDQFLLNGATDAAASLEFHPFAQRVAHCQSERELITDAWTRVYRDVVARKLTSAAFFHPPFASGLGIRGRLYGAGYRRDGSYRIGLDGASPFDEVRGRMARGSRRYEYGEHVSPEMVASLREFLDEAHRRGIFVAAMLPPYAPTIYDEMRAEGHWTYVQEVQDALRPEFERRGFVIRDFSDARAVGLVDGDFYDGFHSSERGVATLLLEMAGDDARVAEIVDTARIRTMLAATPREWQIVPGL